MDSRAHRLALTVQIRLALNRTDLALKEVQAAKKWAQDSLLVNLAESWVGLRIVSSRIAKQKALN
jgi:coatomer protein complex subunit epsilon